MSERPGNTHERLRAVEEKSDSNEAKVDKNTNLTQWLLSTARNLGLANVVVLLTFAGSIGGAVLYTSRAWAADMKAISDAGVSPVAQRLEAHIKADAEAQKDQKEFNREVLRLVGELAADNRANYRAIRDGTQQYRMERPLPIPDGGP